LDRSVIILAGDSSVGFEEDKGLLKLDNKPLLNRVVSSVKGIVEEVIVVTSSQERVDLYSKIVPPTVRFVINDYESKGPLAGALAGFEAAQGKYSLLLTFDAPFVSKEVITLLFDLSTAKSAVIPRSPDCEMEPLQAVYNTAQALEATKSALASNEFDLQDMISKLRGVRYISTMVIEQLDPDLKTFFTIYTPLDMRKAVVMLKPRRRQ
jgi:molybdopterin-guanine dinucleotide biosynthesis protein A